MATIYICKCGRRVSKSTNADNTGNRDTENCKGCPYLLPWGPFEFVKSQGFVRNVKGYECRMSKDIEYATRFCGSIDDKCSCYIASLDFDFLTRVSNWIKETYPGGELNGSFFTDDIRAVEYVSNGRYRMSIGCAQNKKGIAAKAALLHQFFDASGARLDMTPEEEKVHILAAIEAGKAKASGKEKDMQVYTNQYGTLFAVREHNGSPALMCKAKESEQWVMSGVLAAVKDDAKTIGELQAVLDKAAQKYNWEPVENVPVENPTNAAEDVQQCAPTASNAPLSQSQSVNADAQQGGGDDSGEPVFTVGKTIPAGTEARRRVKGYAAMRCGEVSVIHVCRQKPESVKIWLNSMMPSEYWVMSKSGDVCGEHVEICPYCEADLKNGEGDVLIVPFGHSENFTPAAPASPVDAGAATQSQSTAEPVSLAADLPDVCQSCQCVTCGNEDCPTPCFQKDDEVQECKKLGPMGDACEYYQPKEDAQCQKENAPSAAAAAATSDGSAARMCEGPDEETRITPAAASGAALESLHAQAVLPQNAPAQDIAADAPSTQAFDYSGLDAETAERLQNLARRAMEAKQRYVLDLMEVVTEAHRELVARCDKQNNQHSENTFRAWCASIGVGKDTAYRLLQVQALMDGSTPEEQEALADAPVKLLYAAAKPSAPAELVQAVKDGDITTHKQFKELEAKLKAEREARVKAQQDLETVERARDAEHEANSALLADEQRRRQAADEARIAAEKKVQQYREIKDAALENVKMEQEKAVNAELRARAAEEDAAEKDKRIRELETGRPQTIEATVVERIRMPEMAEEDAAELTTNLAASVTTVQRSFFMAAAAMAPQVKARCANTLWDTVNELATLLAASANPSYEEEEATPFD